MLATDLLIQIDEATLNLRWKATASMFLSGFHTLLPTKRA